MPTVAAASAEIRALTQSFVDALVGAVQRAALEQVKAALGEVPTGPARQPRAKATAARPAPRRAAAKRQPRAAAPLPAPSAAPAPAPKRARRGRANTEETAERILEVVGRRPGILSEEARAELGIEKPTWLAGIAKLKLAGRVRAEGEKRATRYYPASPSPASVEPFAAVPPIKRRARTDG